MVDLNFFDLILHSQPEGRLLERVAMRTYQKMSISCLQGIFVLPWGLKDFCEWVTSQGKVRQKLL